MSGRDALDLGAFAVNPIELLDRELEGTSIRRLRAPAVTATELIVDREDAAGRSLCQTCWSRR